MFQATKSLTLTTYLAVLALLPGTCLSIPAHAEQVCSVHDGDTIKLCTGQSVRFHGIDAPELHQPMGYEFRDFLMSYLK